ncbi:DMT family transporter [Cellulophaga sp. F20128]|uniref:DMT family transporter n=1 Tax=Cellulophaga sp. F20128 TaxID=2926413 RepID=UPI001FF1494E|nr:DMT family transporter [Cellulophaga sp. F20128]MCK0157846.1 DMT family transporter [Cellulophaga sp. F20128]
MVSKSSASLGVLYAVLGVVLFSAKAVLVKLAYQYHIDTVTLLLFRMLFSLPFYITIALLVKPLKPAEIKKTDYLWIVFFGCIGYHLASYFDFVGLQYIKAGLERIILFVYPTIVVLLSWLVFRHKISKTQFRAILIAYFGILIIFWNEVGWSGNDALWGGFMVLLSAIAYASYLVGSGWLLPKFGVLTFTAYAMLVSTAAVLVHYLFVGNYQLLDYPMEVYILAVVMAIFSTLIPSFLVSAAIKQIGAATFSVYGSLGPVATIVLAYFFLDEKISYIQGLGMLVVIYGIVLISIKKKEIN